MRRIILTTIAAMILTAPAWALEIPVTVTEPAGLERADAPVFGGIPLPRGEVKDAGTLQLVDAAGQPVALQVDPLVTEPDGSLRWVLLSFKADLKPHEAKTFTLKTGQAKAPAAKSIVADGADAVTIDTGRATLVISRSKPFALFDSVAVGGRKVVTGGSASYTDGTDASKLATYPAKAPDSVTVEYAGALRATVCIKGHFDDGADNGLGYVARITAWAGHSDVEVKYSLTNSTPDHYTHRRIKDSSVVLTLASAGETTVGLATPIKAGGDVAVHQGLGARVSGGCVVTVDGKQSWSNAVEEGAKTPVEVCPGWLVSGGSGVGVADLYFTDDPARALSAGKAGLVLTGVAERFCQDVTDKLDGPMRELNQKIREEKDADAKKKMQGEYGQMQKEYRSLGLPFYAKYRWLLDSTHISSFYVIDFATDAAGMARETALARAPLHALAPSHWYFDTEALAVGRFGTQADEMKAYEKWGWKFDAGRAPKGPGVNDRRRYIRGEDNHYETEEDIVESLTLMYLRTGDRAFFDYATGWANYNMDLQPFRTDGWRFKDGGVWWTSGGPSGGNSPQRPADPVTGLRNGMPAPWGTGMGSKLMSWGEMDAQDCSFLANSKACYCHNWGEGIAGWYCITGDRDALETAVDDAEQNYDAQRRAFSKTPGKTNNFSRDFTRSCYLINAARELLPNDPFLIEAGDYVAAVFLKRPVPEPRGLVQPAGWNLREIVGKADSDEAKTQAVLNWAKGYVGQQGVDAFKASGVTIDFKTGELVDPRTGARWQPNVAPHTWMFPPLSNAMELYYRLTGNEDARDWVIAFGQGASRVLYQPRHGNLYYGKMLADWPVKGEVKDYASWVLPADADQYGQGLAINGYLAEFYPDVCARAYYFAGVTLCKQRAYDFWFSGSHRGYNSPTMSNVGGVAKWVNYYGVHSETVCFTGKTFYVWSHDRADGEAPAAVKDLAVSVSGGKATANFTGPADAGGGKVASYQLKFSDKPIVSYEAFLPLYAAGKDNAVTNWFLAGNVAGEPAPATAGLKVSLTVEVPEGAKYFALVSFDDSSNRSDISNVAEAK
ncbi:MAG: hypothetical protein BIFFINMI_01121 [Phycisphaerae bacterium]|nr:hypothetical protein [Phycisphaerae bacterium]